MNDFVVISPAPQIDLASHRAVQREFQPFITRTWFVNTPQGGTVGRWLPDLVRRESGVELITGMTAWRMHAEQGLTLAKGMRPVDAGRRPRDRRDGRPETRSQGGGLAWRHG